MLIEKIDVAVKEYLMKNFKQEKKDLESKQEKMNLWMKNEINH